MVALYKGSGTKQDKDNWRGICLLPLLSKLVACQANLWLCALMDAFLDESQVGFRALRSAADAIFVTPRVLEEARATEPPPTADPTLPNGVFALFVDLKKAFDSAPRTVLWRLLAALGVPEGPRALLVRMHTDLRAQVKLDGCLSEFFSMDIGVRQGAVEAPSLWNLYFHLIIRDWRRRCK